MIDVCQDPFSEIDTDLTYNPISIDRCTDVVVNGNCVVGSKGSGKVKVMNSTNVTVGSNPNLVQA